MYRGKKTDLKVSQFCGEERAMSPRKLGANVQEFELVSIPSVRRPFLYSLGRTEQKKAAAFPLKEFLIKARSIFR